MKRLAIVLALSGAFMGGAANALTIDNFDTGTQNLTKNDNTSTSSNVSGLAGTDTIGTTRKLNLTGISGATAGLAAAAKIDVGDSNFFSVSNDPSVDSTVTVIWDADGGIGADNVVKTNGLGGADLTDGNTELGFVFDLIFIDLNVTIDLTVWDMAGNNDTFNHNFPIAVDNYFIPFTEFVGVDPTNVGAIRLVLNGPAGWDAIFNIVDTRTGIPVPAPLALIGLGLFGLGAVRRRSQSA